MGLIQVIKEEIKNEIVDELLAAREYDIQKAEPYIRDVGGIMLNEHNVACQPGQMISGCNGEAASGWSADAIKSQGSKVLYGVGTIVLLGMFLPHFRRKIGTVVGRTASEGLDLFEQARSIVARAREDVEDIIAEANFNGLMKKSRK